MKPKFLIYQSQIATDQDVFSDTCNDVPRADKTQSGNLPVVACKKAGPDAKVAP